MWRAFTLIVSIMFIAGGKTWALPAYMNYTPQGWYRIGDGIIDVNGKAELQIINTTSFQVRALRIYPRALRVNEAIENQRAASR